jgi:drug/metabolite transporter (DMT)-like permease
MLWTAAAFVGVVAIGGANLVAVKYANGHMDPFFGSGLRFGVAGAILAVVAVVRRVPPPTRAELPGTALYGLLGFGGSMAFAYWALQDLPASVAGVILAGVPVMTLVLAAIQGLEPFRIRALLGGVITIAGVAVLLGGSGSATIPLRSVLAMAAGALCFSEAGIVIKRLPPCHAIAANGLGMLIGAAVLLTVSLIAGESWTLPTAAGAWVALAYLVVIGSIIVFWLYLVVLRGWSASRASYQFVLMPFAAALLAAGFLSEPITWRFVVGGLLALAGVFAGALAAPPPAVPASVAQEAMAQRCATT